MPVTHEPWLVALSLVVAIQGAYVGLSLAVQVGEAVGARRRWLLAGASLSLGVAIWAMHFVAMLAARLPVPVDYLVFPTLLSFLVCVLVVGAAVFAVSVGPLTPVRLVASAVFMGLGIVSMHYIGMAALHDSAEMSHDPAMVAASIAIAIAASGLALRLATGPASRRPLLISAAALGIAISGMHYTAMAGLSVFPHSQAMSSAPAISVDFLAIIVAIVAFIVSSLFFLVLVPERIETGTESMLGRVGGETVVDAVTLVPQRTPANPEDVGQPFAEVVGRPRHLPVEHEGIIRHLPVENIVAVQANAHYTYLFDGTAKHFCPLAIGDVESRLDPARFARVHRSHIVNIERVVRLRRRGDTGFVELTALHDGYLVPVSRSRLAWVKAHLVGPGQTSAIAS
jgi:diguanylate cyclase